MLHTRSLSVEEQFYVVFPLFLMFAWKFGFKLIVPTLILVMLASLSLSEWGLRNAPVANFYLAPTRAWELLVGSLAALYELKRGVLRSEAALSRVYVDHLFNIVVRREHALLKLVCTSSSCWNITDYCVWRPWDTLGKNAYL